LTDAILTPAAPELLELFRGAVAVERRHVGKEFGLRVDLRQRVEVVLPPLPKEQTRGP
jgi:hypothetical protein